MPQETYKLVIVGTGFGGLCLAAKLREQGIEDFIILEKAHGVGGTWRENTYPGAECDIPSALYSYSFAPNPTWDFKWAKQPQILQYLEDFAKDRDLLRHVKFGTMVTGDDYKNGRWTVHTQSGETYDCQFFVSAIGQLHVPSTPDFKGKDTFKGASFHSAQWDHSVDLNGKAIGVIGVGASAAQLIPEVAKLASQLTIYQRSPNWVINKGDRPYTRLEKWIAKHIPAIARLYRKGLWMQGEYVIWPIIQGAKLRSKIERWWAQREMKLYIKDEELQAKLTPDYPIGAKRILFSDVYYPALAQENVTLETDDIAEIRQDGIVTKNGTQYQHDVIIYATGFYSNPFLKEIDVRGENQQSLREHWKDGAFAYLGVTTSGFPNMFMLYGPNTNSGHTSIIDKLEHQVTHILRLIEQAGTGVIAVKAEPEDAFNIDAQTRLQKLTWNAIEASWYKDGGRITNNWPGGAKEFKRRLENPIWEHFDVSQPPSDKVTRPTN